jgi:hypothetical protein
MSKPYLTSVVISPHVYGPSVTHNTVGYKGEALWDGLDLSVGYLNKKGYCHKGRCHVFPIAIGEFGSKFVNPEDLAHLRDFTAWLRNEVPGHQDTHKPINNWFYVSLPDLPRHSSMHGCMCAQHSDELTVPSQKKQLMPATTGGMHTPGLCSKHRMEHHDHNSTHELPRTCFLKAGC